MFRKIRDVYASVVGITPSAAADKLVKLHPAELMLLLESAWQVKSKNTSRPAGHPDHRSDIEGLSLIASAKQLQISELINANSIIAFQWHLIYAYMIENTRIYEIFRRVVHEFLHGEKLGSFSEDSQQWLRNTEELFYKDPLHCSIIDISSHIRSDMGASRRNAYWRMFGMDLNHGTDDGRPYPYIRAEAANSEFVTTFEELLRELWVGIIHVGATAAPKPTDKSKIAVLATNLCNMLRARRQYGNLSREEFAFVSMMSWFHLSVESDLPIIKDLKAEAPSAEQRLFKIAQRVGLPAHGLSKSLFDITDPISTILIEIEKETYNTPAAASKLYDASATGSVKSDIETIITHWSLITGRDVKADKVAVR